MCVRGEVVLLIYVWVWRLQVCHSPPYFLRKCLSLNSVFFRLDWLAGLHDPLVCSFLPDTEIINWFYSYPLLYAAGDLSSAPQACTAKTIC